MRTFDRPKGKVRRKKKKPGMESIQRHIASLDTEAISRMIADSAKPYGPKGGDVTAKVIYESTKVQTAAIQPKLQVSQPQDKAEQQADKVADGVSKGDTTISRSALEQSTADIHTKGEDSAMTTTTAFDNQLSGTKGQGQKLGNEVKTEMEGHLNTDLSGVNIHTGGEANKMSEDINAKAFTHGQDVYFNEGQYNTSSNEGKSLLAHELTHTVQQSGGIQRKEKKPKRPAPTSTKTEAEKVIANANLPAKSTFWPKVDPVKYIANISANVNNSAVLYQGKSTNFCGYAAMMTFVIEKDPAGYAQMMIDLYKNGKAVYKGGEDILFEPATTNKKGEPTELANAPGGKNLDDKFKRPDIQDDKIKGIADQVMFLTMADTYKGYVNPDKKYDEGNENTVWAGTNLGKFMDMMVDFGYEAKEWGSDLGDPFHNAPKIILREQAKGNDLFLYINSHTFKKPISEYKAQTTINPNHFIRVKNFKKDETVSLEYWDYGLKDSKDPEHKTWNKIEGMTLAQFNRSTFGVISVKKDIPVEQKNTKKD